MIVDKITDEIVRHYKTGKVLLVSLCGWADTGKSTMARQLCVALNERKIKSDHISTDAFMMDRSKRNAAGISGYNPASLNGDDLVACISRLSSRTEVKYYPYDNRQGSNSEQYRMIGPCDVIIIEGLHSFHPAIRDQAGLRLYIDAPAAILEALRFNANRNKRGFTATEAGLRIPQELKEYYQFVFPGKAYAHMHITVDHAYRYTIG